MTGAHDKPLRHVHSCRKHHDEEVASSKKKRKKKNEFKTRVKKSIPSYYQNEGKMAKIDTLFMTTAAEKPYPIAPHITI